MLELKNIYKTFNPGTINEKRALNGLNLKLNEGDFVTVIGGNGAGKSTMLNAVAGTWPVDEGQILIDNIDVTKLSEHKRATYLGRVFQDPMTGTAATMGIEENLALAKRRGKSRLLRSGITKAEREEYKELLKILGLGLEDRLTSKVGLLSGGQRQALTLLMATLQKPKLLLLDEHTAALDPKTATKVLEITDMIVNRDHLTTLMITHNMKDAIAHGNRLIMMMEGKKDFNLENVLRKIYGTEYTPVQAVRAALELLLYTERLQLFEADAIRNAAGNGILRLAAREPEAFANNDVAASYQLLKEDTARELNLGRFLNRLDDEWKSIYCKRYGGRVSRREYRESYDRPEQRRPYPGSARTRYELDEDEEMDEEDESSPIILIIAAVVALLVGVAISLVLCLLVPDKITMAISIGLILVGITGDIVIIIHNIIASKRRER